MPTAYEGVYANAICRTKYVSRNSRSALLSSLHVMTAGAAVGYSQLWGD